MRLGWTRQVPTKASTASLIQPPPTQRAQLLARLVELAEVLTLDVESCKMATAPLSDGLGFQGKVDQALSGGLLAVGSPDALEGMRLNDKREAMITETP